MSSDFLPCLSPQICQPMRAALLLGGRHGRNLLESTILLAFAPISLYTGHFLCLEGGRLMVSPPHRLVVGGPGVLNLQVVHEAGLASLTLCPGPLPIYFPPPVRAPAPPSRPGTNPAHQDLGYERAGGTPSFKIDLLLDEGALSPPQTGLQKVLCW